jgi:hypothetical protein
VRPAPRSAARLSAVTTAIVTRLEVRVLPINRQVMDFPAR